MISCTGSWAKPQETGSHRRKASRETNITAHGGKRKTGMEGGTEETTNLLCHT